MKDKQRRKGDKNIPIANSRTQIFYVKIRRQKIDFNKQLSTFYFREEIANKIPFVKVHVLQEWQFVEEIRGDNTSLRLM